MVRKGCTSVTNSLEMISYIALQKLISPTVELILDSASMNEAEMACPFQEEFDCLLLRHMTADVQRSPRQFQDTMYEIYNNAFMCK